MANQSYDDMELTAQKELAAILDESQLDPIVDIDKTLNDKAKKNQLTKSNVKNLIKNVLTNDDVATMLRQTLDNYEDGNCLYEPKLTRAKIREMLKTYPPSVHQWSSNEQESIISECRLLIEKEFAEDSEDEEYQPDKALDYEEDDDDDDESKCTEINKSLEIDGEPENVLDDQIIVASNDKETIGMRTRSKFSLNDTPLEIIEQAFIPPDITEDMYDSACENDEWMEFLSEFTKPLESVQNDDGEDDPEYNVLCDDDFTNVDKEEFRIDKSVKVTRKEYNDLMNELYEFTESYIEFNGCETLKCDTVNTENDDNKNLESKNSQATYSLNDSDWKSNVTCSTNDENNVKPITSITSIPVYTTNYSDWKLSSTCPTNNVQTISYSTQLVPQINCNQSINEDEKNNYVIHISTPVSCTYLNTEQNSENISDEFTSVENSGSQHVINTVKENGMTNKQAILLKHQLTQHVQIMTQSYMLCPKAQKYQIYRNKFKSFLKQIRCVCKDKNYEPINIQTALTFIEEWTDLCDTFEKDIKEDFQLLPSNLQEFMLLYEFPLFIYPNLLPTRTYRHDFKNFPMQPPEEKFFLLKIDQIFKQFKESARTRRKYMKMNLSDMIPLILPIVHKRWFSHRKLSHLKSIISRRKLTFEDNIIKNYLDHSYIEDTVHIVDIGAVFEGKRLYECDINKFPPRWKSLAKDVIKKKSCQ